MCEAAGRGAGIKWDPELEEASRRLDVWIERESFAGWDPHDALNSPALKNVTRGSRRLGMVWVQLFKRSPLNLRLLARVPKARNPKAIGLFLQTYIRKYQTGGDPRHLALAKAFAAWLRENTSPGFHGLCWGYHFDWPNRSFFAPAGTPTVVNTAFAGLAFLDLHHFTGDASALAAARSACNFVLHDLNVRREALDELCFSYTPLDSRVVHNSNLLGAWLLAAVCRATGEAQLAGTALQAARFSARRQRAIAGNTAPEGFWPYGEAANDGWIDNFHTGFVLVALRRIASALEVGEFNLAIESGYRFWKRSFFLADGTPKYYAGKIWPIDAHSAAQAILTFLEFADYDPEAAPWAARVARWTIRNMQSVDGSFYYQLHRRFRNRIPYMRWSQAWMQRALAELALAAQKTRIEECKNSPSFRAGAQRSL